jgi:hypothetical protein
MYYQNYSQSFNPSQVPYATPYQQMPVLTQGMHRETTKLIDKMKEVAESFLPVSIPLAINRETQRMAAPTINPINFDFSRREYNLFSSRETHHHHADPMSYPNAHVQREQEKKNQATNNLLIGILGFGIMAATAYFLGKNDAQNEEAQEEEVSFETLKRNWAYNRFAYHAQGLNVAAMEDSINKVDGILTRNQTERAHRTALLLFTFSAGVLLTVGALAGSALLINSGFAVGAGTTIFALYKLGYTCFSNRNVKDAKIVENNLNALRYPMQNILLAM